jgi:hypothetical protein
VDYPVFDHAPWADHGTRPFPAIRPDPATMMG